MPRGPRGEKRPAYASMSDTTARVHSLSTPSARLIPSVMHRNIPGPFTASSLRPAPQMPLVFRRVVNRFSTAYPLTCQPVVPPLGGAGRPKQSIVTVGLTAECLAEPLIGRAFARPGGYNDGLHPAGRVKLSNRFNKSARRANHF